jgi:DNA polymerase III subunit delta'
MTNVTLEPRANPELHGQSAALSVLRRALLSGRLPHGWLFTGPSGVGKATLAYRFARILLAAPPTIDEDLTLPPDHPMFGHIAKGTHPDLKVIEPERDPKSGKVKPEITVDAVRATCGSLHSTAAAGGRRLVIVDGAERLNRNAANAMLKPLEEPPPGTVLILISHRPDLVAPTLRSRCARLHLRRLPETVIGDALARQAPDLPAEARLAIARAAGGSLGRALEMADPQWLGLYQRLATCLAEEQADVLALHGLAGELARYAEPRNLAASAALLQELVSRAVRTRLERGEAPLFAEEPGALRQLAGRRPLECWARLWEKIARLVARVDGLNLDRTHALLHMLILLALPSGQGTEAPDGGSRLTEAADVVG